jgi:transposase-like protein
MKNRRLLYERSWTTVYVPPDQGQLTSEERTELARLRQENRELRREKDFFRLAAAHFAKEQLPPRGFA